MAEKSKFSTLSDQAYPRIAYLHNNRQEYWGDIKRCSKTDPKMILPGQDSNENANVSLIEIIAPLEPGFNLWDQLDWGQTGTILVLVSLFLICWLSRTPKQHVVVVTAPTSPNAKRKNWRSKLNNVASKSPKESIMSSKVYSEPKTKPKSEKINKSKQNSGFESKRNLSTVQPPTWSRLTSGFGILPSLLTDPIKVENASSLCSMTSNNSANKTSSFTQSTTSS